MAYKTFANGFPLPASDLNNYLMNQSVIVFADSTARTAALPTPTEGMITYLEDTNTVEVYDGSAWTDINDNTAAIPKSTVTTAGDLIVADGASSVTRLGAGSDGSLLTVDSGSPAYLAPGTDDQVLTLVSGAPAWADAAGGGGATLLSTTTLSGTTTTISSISQDYQHLIFEISRPVATGYAGDAAAIYFEPNNTASNRVSFIYDASLTSNFGNSFLCEVNNGDNSGTSVAIRIFNYTKSGATHPFTFTGKQEGDGGGAALVSTTRNAFGTYDSFSAITSARFRLSSGSFTSGTVKVWGL